MYRGDSQQLCPFILTSFPFFFFISCDLFSFSTLSQWTCTDVGKRGKKKTTTYTHTHTHVQTVKRTEAKASKNKSCGIQEQLILSTALKDTPFFFFITTKRWLADFWIIAAYNAGRENSGCGAAAVELLCVCVCDIRYRVTTLSRGMQHVLKQAMRLHNTVPTF